MPENEILSCVRYAYRPNKLQYCGPDKNKELLQVMEAAALPEARNILENFECLYPYVKYIANRNMIADPLSAGRAYWVGGNILENTGGGKLFEHLENNFAVRKKYNGLEIEIIERKIATGANAHHSFHVFNVWQNPRQAENPHVLYQMDECRVGWGKVIAVAENIIDVSYEPVIYNNGKLAFGAPQPKKIFYELSGRVKPGDWISFHWSSFCEVLSPADLKNLIYWTTVNLQLANTR